MEKRQFLTVIFVGVLIFPILIIAGIGEGRVFGQDHIKELDGIRSAMTEVGNNMPEIVKKSEPGDLRTFERVYEINNYALVTIESYLKMLRVAITSGGGLNKDVIAVLNGWLGFIKHYCEYDVKYFDEVLAETKNESVVKLLNDEKKNILALKEVSDKGIKENTELLSKL